MHKFAAAALFTFLISGCADPGFNIPRTIVMQNPKTKEVAQCHHDANDLFNAQDIDACVNGYKQAGWKQLTDPASQL